MKVLGTVEIDPMSISPPLKPLRDYSKVLKSVEFQGLVDSIKSVGILQMPGVKSLPDGTYRCIFGWMRISAAIRAGKKMITTTVIECDEQEEIALSLIENVRRFALPWGVVAETVITLHDGGWTYERIANELGYSPDYLRKTSSIYSRLVDELKKYAREFTEGEVGTGRATVKLPEPIAYYICKLPSIEQYSAYKMYEEERWTEEYTKAYVDRVLLKLRKEEVREEEIRVPPKRMKVTTTLPEEGQAKLLLSTGKEVSIRKLPTGVEDRLRSVKIREITFDQLTKEIPESPIAPVAITTLSCPQCRQDIEIKLYHIEKEEKVRHDIVRA